MREWREKEDNATIDTISRDFGLTESEKKLVKYLYGKIRRHGVKKVHPRIRRHDLIVLLVFLAFRHYGRRRMIHENRDRFWFDPSDKALVALSNILGLVLRERPLFRR